MNKLINKSIQIRQKNPWLVADVEDFAEHKKFLMDTYDFNFRELTKLSLFDYSDLFRASVENLIDAGLREGRYWIIDTARLVKSYNWDKVSCIDSSDTLAGLIAKFRDSFILVKYLNHFSLADLRLRDIQEMKLHESWSLNYRNVVTAEEYAIIDSIQECSRPYDGVNDAFETLVPSSTYKNYLHASLINKLSALLFYYENKHSAHTEFNLFANEFIEWVGRKEPSKLSKSLRKTIEKKSHLELFALLANLFQMPRTKTTPNVELFVKYNSSYDNLQAVSFQLYEEYVEVIKKNNRKIK